MTTTEVDDDAADDESQTSAATGQAPYRGVDDEGGSDARPASTAAATAASLGWVRVEDEGDPPLPAAAREEGDGDDRGIHEITLGALRLDLISCDEGPRQIATDHSAANSSVVSNEVSSRGQPLSGIENRDIGVVEETKQNDLPATTNAKETDVMTGAEVVPGPEAIQDEEEPHADVLAAMAAEYSLPLKKAASESHVRTNSIVGNYLVGVAEDVPISSEDVPERGNELETLTHDDDAAAATERGTRIEDSTMSPDIERGDSYIHVIATDVTDVRTVDPSDVTIFSPWWKERNSWLYSWAALCLSSAIALAAYKTNPDHERSRERLDVNNRDGPFPEQENWDGLLTAWPSVSLSVAAMASLAHVSRRNPLRKFFVGTVLEGILSLFLLITWAAALLMFTDPNQGLAMEWREKAPGGAESGGRPGSPQQGVHDSTLYFSCWGSTICAQVLFSMYLGEQRDRILSCLKLSVASDGMGLGYTFKWGFLGTASLVVSIESYWFMTNWCAQLHYATCYRNIYGIATGSIGLATCWFMTISSYLGRDSALVTTSIGFAMVADYTVCVGMLCFGFGPATAAGNQFFSAWAGFSISLYIFGGALKEYLNTRASDDIPVGNVSESAMLIGEVSRE